MKAAIVLLLCVAPDNHDQASLELHREVDRAARKQLQDVMGEINHQPYSYMSGWYKDWIERQWDIKWLKARGHATYHLTPFLDRSHK